MLKDLWELARNKENKKMSVGFFLSIQLTVLIKLINSFWNPLHPVIVKLVISECTMFKSFKHYVFVEKTFLFLPTHSSLSTGSMQRFVDFCWKSKEFSMIPFIVWTQGSSLNEPHVAREKQFANQGLRETSETEIYKIIKECEKLSEEKVIDQTTYEDSLD